MENSQDLNKILANHSREEPDYIALLQEIQDEYRYLPREVLQEISRQLGISLSRLYTIATFYNCFSLIPKGKYEIHVCTGTACHVRGAGKVLDLLSKKLGIKPGETTQNLQYSLEQVNCLGACAFGPIVTVNEHYHSSVTLDTVDSVLEVDHEQD